MPNQHHLYSVCGVLAPKASHPRVKAIKRQQDASIHGNKVWPSSFALMDYLTKHPLAPMSRVLDIGCGWGNLACFLAKTFHSEVVAMDADPQVKPFLELTIELNGLSEVLAPRFQEGRFEALSGKELGEFDVLTGSDICFWDEMTQPLFALIETALAAGVKEVYIADPGRGPFWELADLCAEHLYAEVVSHRVTKPRPSEKHIIVIHEH